MSDYLHLGRNKQIRFHGNQRTFFLFLASFLFPRVLSIPINRKPNHEETLWCLTSHKYLDLRLWDRIAACSDRLVKTTLWNLSSCSCDCRRKWPGKRPKTHIGKRGKVKHSQEFRDTPRSWKKQPFRVKLMMQRLVLRPIHHPPNLTLITRSVHLDQKWVYRTAMPPQKTPRKAIFKDKDTD